MIISITNQNLWLMKRFGLIIIIFFTIVSCKNGHSNDEYLVNGKVKNIPDSTLVRLYLDMETVIDSTIVINEAFQFKGNIERPKRVLLRLAKTSDSRMFWLENNKIEIIGEKGNMRNSIVKGSNTQKEADLLLKLKDSIYQAMEKLGEMVTEHNQDSLFAIHEKMIDAEVAINKKFITDHPNSYESLTVLHQSTMKRIGATETKKLFSKLNKELQLTEEGKSILNFITLNKNPKVGEKYVDFVQTNDNGNLIKVSDVLGKYTLIEFWASWCGPCRGFNPELRKVYDLYKENGFEIVGVSLDSNKKKWLKAIEADSLTWVNLSDTKGWDNEAATIYGITAIPDNFLIDENGIIVARYIRGKHLKEKLKELFAKETNI